MSLPQVTWRLVTDEAFRDQMKTNPREALATAGLSLSEEELDALNHVSWDALLEGDGPTWWGNVFSPSLTHLL